MSIKQKLIITFLASAIIPALLIAILSYSHAKRDLENTRIAGLESIGNLKVKKIEEHFRHLREDVEIAQEYYNIKTNLPILTKFATERTHPEYKAAKEMLDSQLKAWLLSKKNAVTDFMLISPEGKIVYANNEQHEVIDLDKPLPDPDGKAFENGKNKIYVSDIFRNWADNNKPGMLMTGPVNDFNDKFIGVIALEIDMYPVFELIRDTTGLGETGETLIGKRVGDEVVFLNPLRHEHNDEDRSSRHDHDEVLNRKVTIGSSEAIPIQKAVLGENGHSISFDYRGTEIIAHWEYIPSLDWGLVAKIDSKEAFASIISLRNWIIKIGIIFLSLVVIVALSTAKSIAKPIQALQKGTEIIGRGDLGYKVGTDAKDEIGQFSRAFDNMTQNLEARTLELQREIENRKQAEETLEHYVKELEKSNQELEQFAYVASHDLQEPLRMVSSFTQLLAKRYKGKLDTDADEFIAFAVDGAERMQRLINDLLDYSHVRTQREDLKPTNITTVIGQALDNLKILIEENDAIVNNQDTFPTIMAYGPQLTRLFQNLIGNSIKFRTESIPKIKVGVKSKKSEWLFSIKDNGIGIAPEFKDRIFDIFRRLHSKEEYSGTGIGLAVCKKIVEGYNGQIWVESEQGKGSTFYFTIPKVVKGHIGRVRVESEDGKGSAIAI